MLDCVFNRDQWLFGLKGKRTFHLLVFDFDNENNLINFRHWLRSNALKVNANYFAESSPIEIYLKIKLELIKNYLSSGFSHSFDWSPKQMKNQLIIWRSIDHHRHLALASVWRQFFIHQHLTHFIRPNTLSVYDFDFTHSYLLNYLMLIWLPLRWFHSFIHSLFDELW